YQETRVVGRAAVTWRSGGFGNFTLGAEGTRYSIADYSHILTTQIVSDVWKEQPVAAAAYLTDHLVIGDVTIDAGLRYQHFTTGAERPWLLDTVSTSAGFNTYLPFPRTSTYGVGGATSGGLPLLQFRPDGSHSGLSPNLAIAVRLDDQTSLHAAAARQLQLPDFATSFAGINTDIQLTSIAQVYGADLGFLDTRIVEVGVGRTLGSNATATITGYQRRDLTRPVISGGGGFDPFAKVAVGFRQEAYVDGGTTNGLEFQLSGRAGVVSGTVAYAYQHTSYLVQPNIFAPDEGDRPHSLTAVATLALPRGWHAGTLPGRLFERMAVTALVRYASGARDYSCPVTSFVAPAVPACPNLLLPLADQAVRLPSIKTVDLRLSRGFEVGGRALSLFVDAHNLFNFTNYTAALSPGAVTSSPVDELDGLTSDSSNFANEATANGVLNGANGSINLTFGGAADPRTGCGAWVTAAGSPASPNCVALIRAEQRYGNGDGIFTVAEQKNASRAQYLLSRGTAALTDLPRRIRIGVQLVL
ncbi:MAG: TonB-dependent receptor domain-containing protein, partial [Gemmatimonadales bacterium]